jgi:hypothetical protein
MMLINFEDIYNPVVISFFETTLELCFENYIFSNFQYAFLPSFTQLWQVPLKSKFVLNASIFKI